VVLFFARREYMDIEEKFKRLKELIRDLKNVAVAFSGGVDSTFLLKVAHMELGDNAIGITVNSMIHPGWEINPLERLPG